jgi:hypothetical protein
MDVSTIQRTQRQIVQSVIQLELHSKFHRNVNKKNIWSSKMKMENFATKIDVNLQNIPNIVGTHLLLHTIFAQ